MDTTPSIYFHLGFAKCASSTLQEFFEGNQNIYYPDRFKMWRKFIPANPFEFDLNWAKDYLKEQVEIAEKEGKQLVLSHERLSGSMFSGHHDAKDIADYIKQACDNPRIILVIRSQSGLIFSCYKQYLKRRGYESFRQFVWPRFDSGKPLFNVNFYKYTAYINYLFSIFGKENVSIFLFEDLVYQADNFYLQLTDFLNIPSVIGGYDTSIKLNALSNQDYLKNSYRLRFDNHYTKERVIFSLKGPTYVLETPFHRLIKGVHRFSNAFVPNKEKTFDYDYEKRVLDEYFSESNVELNKLLDNRLSRYSKEYILGKKEVLGKIS